MSDIMNSMWEPLDDANVHPSPDGVAKEDAPNTVPEVIRAIKGGVKRDVLLRNPTHTSSGAGNTYVLTYPKAPETYYPGQYWFVADKTNTGPVTININGLGSRDILSAGGAPLEPGQIVAGQAVCLAYLGTAFRMQFAHSNPTFTGNLTAATFTGNGAALTALNATALATGTVNNARLPATMTGKTFSSTVTISAGGIDVTGDTSIGGTTAITGNATVSGSLTQGGNRVLTVADVGAGKSLDADLLDGQHGTYYLARANGTGTQPISTVAGLQAAIDGLVSKTGDTITGNLVVGTGANAVTLNASNGTISAANTVTIQATGSNPAILEMRAPANAGVAIDFSPNAYGGDFNWRVVAQPDNLYLDFFHNGTHRFRMRNDGFFWTSALGWINERFADRGAQVQHNSGLWEFGSVDPNYDNRSVDAPNPWVMVGMRSQRGTWQVWGRAVWLRNN